MFLLTWTMPLVVVGVIFRWLFDTQFGVINWIVLNLDLYMNTSNG